MSLSKIIVSGTVIRAPEKRFTPTTNMAVTEFAIAVESNPRPDGSTESTPVKIVTWRDLAERCAQEIKKGDLIAVDGRLQINNYTNSEGQRRRDVEIDAVSVENLSVALSKNARLADDYLETPMSQVGAKVTAKAGAAPKGEELDSIFASEDEIPF
jgi:single-strand DNA-binding protein